MEEQRHGGHVPRAGVPSKSLYQLASPICKLLASKGLRAIFATVMYNIASIKSANSGLKMIIDGFVGNPIA